MKIKKLMLASSIVIAISGSPILNAGTFDWFWNLFGSSAQNKDAAMPKSPESKKLIPPANNAANNTANNTASKELKPLGTANTAATTTPAVVNPQAAAPVVNPSNNMPATNMDPQAAAPVVNPSNNMPATNMDPQAAAPAVNPSNNMPATNMDPQAAAPVVNPSNNMPEAAAPAASSNSSNMPATTVTPPPPAPTADQNSQNGFNKNQ